MPDDKPISQLPSAVEPLTGDERIAIEQNGVTRQVPANKITGDDSFDGDRSIKGHPDIGKNLGTQTLKEFVEAAFFPFVSATISINGNNLYEVGTVQNVPISGGITPGDETIFSNQKVVKLTPNPADVSTFTGNSYSTTDTGVTVNSVYRAETQVDNNGSPTTIYSSQKSAEFIYPIFFGMHPNAAITSIEIYTQLGKLLQKKGDKSILLNGTAEYIYFAYPTAYGDLSSIIDNNEFDITPSFLKTVVAVSSAGLPTDWTEDYNVYKSDLTTVNSQNFKINF